MSSFRFSFTHLLPGLICLLLGCFPHQAYANLLTDSDTTRNTEIIKTLEPTAPPQVDNLINTLTSVAKNPQLVAYAKDKVKKALTAGRFIQKLDSLAWIEFPVVIADTISGVPVAVVFDDLRLYPEYAQLEVIVGVELPQQTVESISQQNVQLEEGGGGPSENAPIGSPSSEYVELYFGTPNLKFSHDGGIIGEALIGLYSDVPIGTMAPEKFAMILRAWNGHTGGQNGVSQGTYAKIDCDGFVEMGVEADVLFSRDWIVPTNANGEVISDTTNQRVTGHFQAVINDWNNLLVEVNLPNFALNNHRQFAFNLSTAIFDFSDYYNGTGMTFPDGYAANYLPPGEEQLWRGVYIKNLSVLLPKQFGEPGGTSAQGGGDEGGQGGMGQLWLDDQGEHQTAFPTTLALDLPDFRADAGLPARGPASPEIPLPRPHFAPASAPTPPTNTRRRFQARDLLIDGHGVSGKFSAVNVFPLNSGRMNKKWRYSLDSVGVELLTSSVTSFGFAGKVALPIAKRGQSFGYSAFANIPDDTYNFTVKMDSSLTFPVFKLAEVQITQGSYISITKTADEFVPTAVLYGYAQVKGKAGSKGDDSAADSTGLSFKVAKLSFHGIKLSTQAPRLSLESGGYLKVENQMNLMGYPLPVVDPTLTMQANGKLKLRFGISLNLMNQQDNGFAVDTDIDILGKLDSLVNYDQYQSDGLKIGKIDVELSLPSLRIKGFAYFFDEDPVYGDGWQGGLEVRVGPSDKPLVEVSLNAIFGHTSYRYWYVDGLVELQNGIPILPPILEINGLGGGAYYHMRMASVNLNNTSASGAGITSSGVQYVPDENITLGLKVILPFQSTDQQTLDGVATLEMVFAGSSLQDIILYGRAEVVAQKTVGNPTGTLSGAFENEVATLLEDSTTTQNNNAAANNSPNNQILGTVYLRLNFEQGLELQGTFRAKFNFANGSVSGDGGVDMLVSFPLNRWHLYIGGYHDNSIIANDGNPLPPVTVNINFSPEVTGSASVYFLLGNDLPGPPPPPSNLGPCLAFPSSGPAQNRAPLTNGRAAQASGLALGAAVQVEIKMRTRRYRCPQNNNSRDVCNYQCNKWGRNKAEATVGAGFDVSLLKYAPTSYCSLSNTSPHGHKGWRATGRLWIFLNVSIKYRGFGADIGLGAGVEADLPKPTYLYVTAYFRAKGECYDMSADFGERCGQVQQ